jgi:RNA polymerase sigma-70 factor (ECF subfamily)
MPENDSGDEASRFARRYFDFVWRVLRRLGLSTADADDAAQQVMLIATTRLADIEPGRERAFLFRTATFVASRERRTRRRRPEDSVADLDDREGSGGDPETLLAARRARERLDAVLRQMPQDLRAAFVLFEIEGLSKEEVAHALEIPPGTAASRLRRAREDFARRARHVHFAKPPESAIL